MVLSKVSQTEFFTHENEKKHYVHKLFVMQSALPNQNKNISVNNKVV